MLYFHVFFYVWSPFYLGKWSNLTGADFSDGLGKKPPTLGAAKILRSINCQGDGDDVVGRFCSRHSASWLFRKLDPNFFGGGIFDHPRHGTGTFIGVFLFMVRCRQIYRTSHGMGCRDPAEQILTLSILGCDHIQFIDECMCCSISMDFGSMYLLWTV